MKAGEEAGEGCGWDASEWEEAKAYEICAKMSIMTLMSMLGRFASVRK